jgi:hypothetical protein
LLKIKDKQLKTVEELPEDFEYVDATSCYDYIAAAHYAMASIEGIDEGMLERKEKAKIKLIRSRSIAIIYSAILELYDERFPPLDETT